MKRSAHKDKQRRPKGRYRFTRADCQKGYRRALEVCSQDWQKAAWFFRHYVAQLLMWRPPVFFREIPRDLTADGHITLHLWATETGLAVHHLRDGVLAVFDHLAVVGAFRRASSVMTASVSDGLPIQAAMLVMWRSEQRKGCFSPSRDSQDHITGKAT